jgi:hypothetical protein
VIYVNILMYAMSRYLAVQKSETSRYIINIMISVIPRYLDILVSDTCYYVFNMRMYDMSEQLNILMSLMSWYLVNIYIYICKTQIRVRPQIRVLPSNQCPIITSCSDPCPSKALSPQICVLWCHTQICVLSKHISSDMCPLTSYSDLCPPEYMFPQICVLWNNTQIPLAISDLILLQHARFCAQDQE